jgi:EAL domain-containing protein (putative c-di-GMP-specific phosphodiesterase class I)
MPQTRIMILSGDPQVAQELISAAEDAGCMASVITPAWELGAALTGFNPELVVVDADSLGTDPVTILDRSAHHVGKTPLIVRSAREERLIRKLCAHLTSMGFVIEQRLGDGEARADVAAALMRFQMRCTRITAAELVHAMEHNELVVNYQPKVSLIDGRPVVGAEALIRWRHPVLGVLGAGPVINLAERSRLHWKLTDWVIEKALDMIGLTEEMGLKLRVSVNAPADYVAEPHFGPKVLGSLEKLGIDPSLLCLEITETKAMREGPAITGALTALRFRGVHLSIDDFGTGYSSLIQLHKLPFDEVKIDQSFVREFPADEGSAAIVASILGLCERLGMEACAEGVETAEAADELQRLGCEVGQGYFFGKPMPAREFLQSLKPATKGDAAQDAGKQVREAA